MRRLPGISLLVLLGGTAPALAGSGRKVSVELQLPSGRQITGLVCEHDDERVILEVQGQLTPVEWAEVETASAYRARKKILESLRGSSQNLTAEDHFQLGYFLAVRNHHAAAVAEFRQAEQRDATYTQRVNEAWRSIRQAKENNVRPPKSLAIPDRSDQRPGAGVGRTRHGMNYMTFTQEQHQAALKALRAFEQFPEANRKKISSDLVPLETRHFLIWTDWPDSSLKLIENWAEQMYQEMCREFDFPDDEPVWLGKCPIFCFKNENTFHQFAEQVDDYDSRGVLGYTKTHPSGYVHVVLQRIGTTPTDLDKFATTMVHEGTHAFMHCYGSPRNLPAWLSEGLADYVAERVLGQRCPTGENAALMAKLFVRDKKSIKELFGFDKSPPAQFYPIAYSLVQYLIEQDADAFIRMINEIKSGSAPDLALDRQFPGMNTHILEHSWRTWVRKSSPR